MIGRNGVLALIAAAGFASSASMRILEPIMPDIGRTFARSAAEVAFLSVSFTVAYAGAQILLAPIGDSRGKFRVVVICLGSVAALTLAASQAGTFSALVGMRLLTGIAAGGIIPLCIALYGDLVPVSDRQVMLARFMVATVSGQMAGATMSGLVGSYGGWRSVLVVGGLFGLMAAAALALPAARMHEPRKPLTFSGALEAYGHVLSNPRAVPLFALVAVEGAVIYGLFPFIAAILEAQSGAGPKEAGLVIGGFAVGGLLFGMTASAVLRHLSPNQLCAFGGVLMTAVLAGFALGVSWTILAPAFALYGFGFYCLHTTFQTEATELSTRSRASAMAMFASSLFMGIAAGPLLFAAISRPFGYEGGLTAFAVATLVLAILAPRVLKLA